jgi:clan AA aspartic protease (TIGR02281 family)
MKTLITFISVVVILNYQTSSYAVQPTDNANTIFKCKTEKGTYTYQEQPCSNKSSTLSSWKPRIKKNTPLFFSMKISPSGTYIAQGSANSIPLVFYIDTGASHVSIPQEIADKAGMACGKQFHAETANGVTTLCESIIDHMTFGAFKIQNVKAMIMPNLKKPLLRMNVLNKFHIEQVKGTMKITDKY